MQLSIRNQFVGTIESVTAGPAMAAVHVRLTGGPDVTAAITTDAATDLNLAVGSAVRVLITSTEVSVAVDPVGRVSIRNQLPGTVQSVDHGAAMTVMKIELAGGGVLTSAITRESAQDLGLDPGQSVTALVKSTDVALALD
jgi:molybdate transport system regulatory protein